MERVEQTALRRMSWSWLVMFMLVYAAGMVVLYHRLPVDFAIEEIFIKRPCTQANYYACWLFDKSNDSYTFILHTLPNALFTAAAIAALLVFLASYREGRFRSWRRESFLLLAGIGGTAGIVCLLKAATAHYCPAQLEYFGGPVGDPLLKQPKPACFPAGHPSPGFGLMLLYFGGARKNWARAGLYGGVAAGCLLGFIQMARGEHFLSHVMATALTASFLGGIVWFLNGKSGLWLNAPAGNRR